MKTHNINGVQWAEDQMRVAIAEACGWKRYVPTTESITRGYPKWGYWISPNYSFGNMIVAIPDYLNDLNAMHEAEKLKLSWDWIDAEPNGEVFDRVLVSVCGGSASAIHASALQRAIAFIQTLELKPK